VDATTIAALAGAGALFVAVFVVAFLAHRRGRRLRTAVFRAREDAREQGTAADAAQHQTSVALAGEREAVWVARASATRAAGLAEHMSELEERLVAAEANAAASEQRVDDLRDEVRRSHADLTHSRAEAEATANRAIELETDLAAADRELSRLRNEVEETRNRIEEQPVREPEPATRGLPERLHAALAETDRLRDRIGALEVALAATGPTAPSQPISERRLLPPDPWEHRRALEDRDAAISRLTAELEGAHRAAETSRGEVDRLAAEIARVREEADRRVTAALSELIATPPPGPLPDAAPSPMLIVREAEIRELEQRLATLTAARNAELRRLNERIASLERLYIDVEVRDARITELESELKQATEMLDAIRSDTSALEARFGEAERELVSAHQAVAAAADLGAQLQESRRRIAEVETVALHARTSDGEGAQLRTMLAAERERNVRLVRRAAVAGRGEVERAVTAATRPLRDTIARLESELEARVEAPPPAVPDDVTLIRGIGPKIAAILAFNGITSLRQIAAFGPADVARIGPLLPVYPQRIVHDRLVEQAREFLAGPG